METIRFEWDENKNTINKEKHHIAFEEAKTVFYDEEALVIDDPEHSEEEERFIILGFSKKANHRHIFKEDYDYEQGYRLRPRAGRSDCRF